MIRFTIGNVNGQWSTEFEKFISQMRQH